MDNNQNTPFSAVYKVFFSLVIAKMFKQIFNKSRKLL